MSQHPPYLPLTITSIREEVPGVKTFVLAPANGGQLSYKAGQFLTFIFTCHGREERRSFSISSSPAAGEPLSITVKRIDNGAFSRLLADKAAIGDTLYTTGAAGLFTLPAVVAPGAEFLFFAAGVGITPVLPLIKELLFGNTDTRAVLFYSNRSRNDIVFAGQLTTLGHSFPGRLSVVHLLSDWPDLSRARLNRQLLPVLLQEQVSVPLSRITVYICGPFNYMRMVAWTLEEAGLSGDQIRRENFNAEKTPAATRLPPDQQPHDVTIAFSDGQTHTVHCTYPESILHAARRQRLQLPNSCEAGQCGSCALKCTSGQVWMSANEVLTARDLAAGLVLTCTGHPINGNVTLQA